MRANSELPTRSPSVVPSRVQSLHSSERTRVTRWFRTDGSVVRKEPLGPFGEARLRREIAALERLSGVAGVPQLVESAASPGSLALVDVGGTPLADTHMPVEEAELLRLAVALGHVVASIHQRGVVHGDINPANVLVSADGRQPYLIDFALATTFAELRPEFTHHNRIVGTLPYLAPEQTGRTGRPVDQRADLYALGATLYELATGDPPFGTGDPLRLSHDLLARVPIPPDRVTPGVPGPLSEIVMRLLEKEPDNRYQTADGLLRDLKQVQKRAPVRIGEHDFPPRLMPPSRLVGRDGDIAALSMAVAGAMAGRCRGVLVSGVPGVGKTALVNELRPIVTAADGWFVAGKFDQYRRDQEFDAVAQAFRALGRLLLAEPDEQLAKLRDRLLPALGPDAGLVAAVVPEFATLLRVAPDPGDPLTAEARAQHIAVEILRAVASPRRPVVLVVDDLQWAARTPLGFIDAVLSAAEPVDGLLMVCVYRSQEVDATHPLAALLARWGRQPDSPDQLRLENLEASSLAVLVADMLRMDLAKAAELAAVIAAHTAGNPYDTVELLNSLRHDRVLTRGPVGWQWDPVVLGRRLDRTDVAGLLANRADSMPSETRAMLDAMACLGGQVEMSVLQAATGQSADLVERSLAPALEDGLLVLELGGQQVVRFRHDRVREIVLRGLTPQRRRALHLQLGRCLASRADLFAVAADQYLPVVDAIHEPAERRQVAELLRQAADQASILSNHPVVERCLAAAAQLIDPADTATLMNVYTGRHTALYSLGRLDENDSVYDTIDRLCTDPLQRVDATSVQISSLTNRNRPREAIELTLDLLRQLGCPVPEPEGLAAEIGRRFDTLHRWVQQTGVADDLRRPDITDPTLLAMGELTSRVMPATYFCDHEMMAWLTLEAARVWAENGPGGSLLGPIGHITFVTAARGQDYRTGHEVMRRVLTVADARGYRPEVYQVRFLDAVSTRAWFEPIEDSVPSGQDAREGLIHSGDLQNAGYTYHVSAQQFIDCAPSLDAYAAEIEAGLAFARRTGNDHAAQTVMAYQWLVRLLRDDASAADRLMPSDAYGTDRLAAAHSQVVRALAAALFGDPAELLRTTAVMMAELPAIVALYPTMHAYLLRALALAFHARHVAASERGTVLAELDAITDWLAARAGDAPVNFLHLQRLVEAERAWAVGDLRAAAHAFDAAQREASTRQRPWHRALILERSAKFYLAHGVERVGSWLLGEARREYLDWGAAAKVHQLDWAYPTLHASTNVSSEVDTDHPDGRPARRSTVVSGTIDLLGILAATQALSSEKSIESLQARVSTALSAMTGATDVHLLLWNGDSHGWVLVPAGTVASTTSPPDEARRQRTLPLSVVRYAERTTEPLMIDDATRDDRFARDPYFQGLQCCSLLVVPIINRGILQALLLLENRLIRGAFATERLDGVLFIAGQLAVSLDNAMVYASLESKVAERTQQLAVANEQLAKLSTTDSLTGLANRRRLDQVLDAEWQRAQRSGIPLGLAIVDIDHFKIYNDRYGHPAGDDCIQRIATELQRNVHATDLVARYGGEEFAVVMPDTDIDAAHRAAEHLRAAVAALGEPHVATPEAIVTTSVGVAAVMPRERGTVQHLVELADVELYRAKRGGRNQVRAAPTQ